MAPKLSDLLVEADVRMQPRHKLVEGESVGTMALDRVMRRDCTFVLKLCLLLLHDMNHSVEHKAVDAG
jgi:hypothetical protein